MPRRGCRWTSGSTSVNFGNGNLIVVNALVELRPSLLALRSRTKAIASSSAAKQLRNLRVQHHIRCQLLLANVCHVWAGDTKVHRGLASLRNIYRIGTAAPLPLIVGLSCLESSLCLSTVWFDRSGIAGSCAGKPKT